jgi:hypothetical protein
MRVGSHNPINCPVFGYVRRANSGTNCKCCQGRKLTQRLGVYNAHCLLYSTGETDTVQLFQWDEWGQEESVQVSVSFWGENDVEFQIELTLSD